MVAVEEVCQKNSFKRFSVTELIPDFFQVMVEAEEVHMAVLLIFDMKLMFI